MFTTVLHHFSLLLHVLFIWELSILVLQQLVLSVSNYKINICHILLDTRHQLLNRLQSESPPHDASHI